jgi:Flp pilus assembly protein TadG
MHRHRSRARSSRRRGAAAVELAVTLPLILALLVGLWESARIIELQQILLNASREGARQAATGQMTNAVVQQVTLQYLKVALNDATGALTANAVITVTDLTHPDRDATAATSLDQIQVTITIPFKDVRWSAAKLVTDDSTVVTSQATWVSLVDVAYPTSAPQPPQG